MVTLKTLHKATAQQVFDHVVNHLLTQKQKCVSTDKTNSQVCMYKNSDGLKCAAGSLISDKEYKEGFEWQPWQYLVDAGYVSSNHSELIAFLQDIHDRNEPSTWKRKLKALAKKRNLEFNYVK